MNALGSTRGCSHGTRRRLDNRAAWAPILLPSKSGWGSAARSAQLDMGFIRREGVIMSSMSLELGEIVNVEVRDSQGRVTSFSHDYPIDASSLLRIRLSVRSLRKVWR